MRNRSAFAVLLCACALVMGCSHTGVRALSTRSGDKSVEPTSENFRFSWALPKTTFNVDATWTFKGCAEMSSGPQIDADVAIQVTPQAVPDPLIKFVELDEEATNSFWQDHDFDIKTDEKTHLLRSFNSTATDQTGAIIGNFVKAAVEIAGVTLAAASKSSEGDKHPSCGDAVKAANVVALDETKLRGLPDQTTEEAKKLVAAISDLQKTLTIKLDTLNIDPGYDKQAMAAVNIVNGREIARLKMPLEKIKRNEWIKDPSQSDAQFDLSIQLNFSEAMPSEFKKKQNEIVKPVALSSSGIWREVAYVPVEIYRQKIDKSGKAEVVMASKPITLPFAQYGASRTLPLDASTFGKAEWTITFNEFGEVTDAKWGSLATGKGVSQLFLDSATAANSIATDATKAPPTDRKTLDLQAENAQLDAVMNNSTKKQACQDMLAKGQVDSCP